MSEDSEVFVPAKGYDESVGQFTRFDPGTRTLPKGFRFGRRYAPLSHDLVFEKDTAVKLRDGVTIYTDIFRPVGEGPFPVVVSWSPYGKTSGASRLYTLLRTLVAVDQHNLSGLMKWEAVDPARWCARGYAVCNPDARGVGKSEGNIQFFGEQEGRDGYDLVEWLAGQKWCSGKVGLAGNSWLAVSQWFTAAEQPPHLTAIAPWEGFSDVYRDQLVPGGIPDVAFLRLISERLPGRNKVESPSVALGRHPLFDGYWQTKAARIERVTVPAYVVASYTSTVHTPGTFRAWERLRGPDRWLRIHNRQEWPDFYQDDNQQDLLRFFDHYLKGFDNGWEATPRVRYSLLDLEGGDVVNRPAPRFPPPGVSATPFYLDGDARSLSVERPAEEKATGYDAGSDKGRCEYIIRFNQETEIVGYPRLKLWVEAEGHDDMDIFVFLQKLDRHGKHLEVQNSGSHNPLLGLITRRGTVLRYKAAPGRLRVSLRRLAPDLSSDEVPVQSFDRVEKLRPGQIVDVDIAIYPVGLLMHPGEQLRLIVAGHNLIGSPMPLGREDPAIDNHGRHIVHTGGRYESRLVLPVRGRAV
ncbi:MAG TPA: CocE/NonD family hydrolase [Polyangia bacterium]|jgi:hypothetical protein